FAVYYTLSQEDYLQYHISQGRSTTALANVPRIAGGWQPLYEMYRREFAIDAENALHQGRNKIDLLFTGAKVLEENELTGLGFKPEMFGNLNTPEEMERARKSK